MEHLTRFYARAENPLPCEMSGLQAEAAYRPRALPARRSPSRFGDADKNRLAHAGSEIQTRPELDSLVLLFLATRKQAK